MRCTDIPNRNAQMLGTSFGLESLPQPAFLASITAEGRVASFRANTRHQEVFGNDAGDMRRRWLEKTASALFSADNCLEQEEQHPARPTGSHWWRLSLFPLVRHAGGRRDVLGLCIDVTRAKAALCDLESAAYEDGLTSLGNRRAFDRDLAAATGGSKPFALLVFDIDRFKPINDRHGHAAGDAVLRSVAVALRQGLRRDDRIYRIGGDEFAALIFTARETMLAAVADRLGARFKALVGPGGAPLSVSIGGARWRTGVSAAELFAVADATMYAAKHRPISDGRNG
ncbi:GGDEF domain-containing protein [Aureimonas psammosilenae]|uniref:GGDEF domain-containing protein n=1 Tax=Aureimonas psammosilenae TaxID=2495496 RepID=UPI001260CDE9|nr:sensor domain-containing diguanylate cyclase [Aureimonas psammosilenae]